MKYHGKLYGPGERGEDWKNNYSYFFLFVSVPQRKQDYDGRV